MIKIKDHQFTGHFTYNQAERVERMLAFVEEDLKDGNLSDFEVVKVNKPKTKVRVKYKEKLTLDLEVFEGADADELAEVFRQDSSPNFAVDNLIFATENVSNSRLEQIFDYYARKTLDPVEFGSNTGVMRVFNSQIKYTVAPIIEDDEFRMGSKV